MSQQRTPAQVAFIKRKLALAEQQCREHDTREAFWLKYGDKTVDSIEPAVLKTPRTLQKCVQCPVPDCKEPGDQLCKKCGVTRWCKTHSKKDVFEALWKQHHKLQCVRMSRIQKALPENTRMLWTVNHACLPSSLENDGVHEPDFAGSWECLDDDFELECGERVHVARTVSEAVKTPGTAHSLGLYNAVKNSWTPLAVDPQTKVASHPRVSGHRTSIEHGLYGTALIASYTTSCLELTPRHLFFAMCEHMRTNWKSWFNTKNLFEDEGEVAAAARVYQRLGNVKVRGDTDDNEQKEVPVSVPPPQHAPVERFVWTTDTINVNAFFTPHQTLEDFVIALAQHVVPKTAWKQIERLSHEQVVAYAWMVFFCADVSRMVWRGPKMIVDACVKTLKARDAHECIHETNLDVEAVTIEGARGMEDVTAGRFVLDTGTDEVFGCSVKAPERTVNVEDAWVGVDACHRVMESCVLHIMERSTRIYVGDALGTTRMETLESWPEASGNADEDKSAPRKTKAKFMAEFGRLSAETEAMRADIAFVAQLFREGGASQRASFVHELMHPKAEIETKDAKLDAAKGRDNPPMTGMLLRWMGRRWGDSRFKGRTPIEELQLATFIEYDFVWREAQSGETRNMTLCVGFCGFEYDGNARMMSPSHIVSLNVRRQD